MSFVEYVLHIRCVALVPVSFDAFLRGISLRSDKRSPLTPFLRGTFEQGEATADEKID